MARRVRAGDAKLMSRTAREALRPSRKPYYRPIERGIALGYRKPKKGPGTWLVRRYVGNDSYSVRNLVTADGHPIFADDHEDANGKTVLDFGQAQDAIRAHKNQLTGSAAPSTVADALADYFRFLKSDGRSEHSIRDAHCRANALILPKLGTVKIAALTSDRLRRWRDDLVNVAPRLRTREGDEQKYRRINGEDAKRARRASANRTWTILRAALNHAFSEGKLISDSAWRKVKPFKKVDSARVRYLTIAEAMRLVNASDAQFRPLLQAALQTGCRYGELIALEVRDFNPDAGTLAIRQSKTGKPRHVVLTDEGQRLLISLTAGRGGHESLLQKTDGQPWRAAHQKRPMLEACERAKITPPINFHGLRHTWASLAVMNHMPLMVVARNLGHSDTRMVEKHYGHLAPSFVADAVRKSAPLFGFKPDRKLATLTGRGRA
jgi:integrase